MCSITRTIYDGTNTHQWGPNVSISSVEEGIGVIKTDLRTLMDMNTNNDAFEIKFNKMHTTYSFSRFGKNYTITWVIQ